MASQYVPLSVCETVLPIRVAERVSKEAECLTDTRPEMKARPIACKVSAPCSLSKVDGFSLQMMFSDTAVIFEVQQTRDRFGKWPLKL